MHVLISMSMYVCMYTRAQTSGPYLSIRWHMFLIRHCKSAHIHTASLTNTASIIVVMAATSAVVGMNAVAAGPIEEQFQVQVRGLLL